MPPASIAERLHRLPITRTHRRIIVIAGIGTFFDLFDIFLAGVLATVLTEQFHLSRVTLPAVLASSFLGMFVGALGFGTIADRVGRRQAFLITLATYSAFTLAGAFTTSAMALVVTRFIAGVGIGAEPPIVDAYLGEMLPTRERGRCTAAAYTLGFFSVPAAGLLARVLVPLAPFGIAGWRWLFVAGAVGGAIVWRVRRHLPESPRWLESMGRASEAEGIVACLEAEAASRAAPPIPPAAPERPSPRVARAGTLWSPEYRGRTAVLCVFHVFQTVGYYGFGTLVPLVLASKGFSVVHSLTYTTLVFLGYPLGSALSVPILERLDRRWLIVTAALLMAAFGLGLGGATAASSIVLCGFAYTVASNVFSNAFHVFQAEIFPTAARATAAGAAYSLSRLSSAAMPFVLLPALQRWGAAAMFALVAAAMLVVVIDIGLFAPPTTGLSLEEIAGPA